MRLIERFRQWNIDRSPARSVASIRPPVPDGGSGVGDFDPVNRPEHYCNGGIECIDAMVITFGKKWVIIFCKLNAFKYRWRAPFKGKMQEDLKKAEWYLNKAEELSE